MTYLGIYLNDHRAAATGGLRVAQRCRDSNEDTELGAFLDDFIDELREDETLVDEAERRAQRQVGQLERFHADAVRFAFTAQHESS